VLDPAAGDVVARIVEITGGGVTAAIEASGFPRTFEPAVRATRPGGRMSTVGYHGEDPAPLRIPPPEFGMGMSDKKILTSPCPGGWTRRR
jgi:isopropanol dehydrogenase (NADP+)